MNDETNDMAATPSLKDRVKNVLANKKVQFGATIAITAVATALISRSDLFETKFSFDDVQTMMNDPETVELMTS